MKKIISMLLVVSMVIAVFAISVATTSAAETTTVTIYGLDGSTETKEFNVGDEFTVYTTLNTSATNSAIGSVQGYQTYSADKLTLADKISGDYGEFEDLVKVFPVTGLATMANGATAGRIDYNATAASAASGFKFDADSSKLIVTTYKVAAAGTAEIKNYMSNLAVADESMTRIVFEGEAQSGKTFAGKASFDDPLPEIDHAHVTVHRLDGTIEEKDFNIGDTFTVYTTLDVTASIADGKVGSVNAVQRYTSSVVALADEVDSDGYVTNLEKMFPVLSSGNVVASAKTAGLIKYGAASDTGYVFNSAESKLITTTYKVTANGYADISNSMIVLAAADEDATRVVFSGVTQTGMSYSMPASFNPPTSEPTEPATQPPTQRPTEAPTTAKITIIGPNGAKEVKEFKLNATFTVYTILDASATNSGKMSSVDGYQTYNTSILQLTDATTGTDNEIADKAAMFPVTGTDTIAGAKNGEINFNASTSAPAGYAFDSDKSKLIVTNYKVIALGEATIETKLRTLIASDNAFTKVVYNEAIQSGKTIDLHEQYTDPGQAVVPTEPTAEITVYGLDGKTETKTYNVGETFTVYTTLNLTKAADDAKMAGIDAKQTYTTSVLKSADTVDSQGVVPESALDEMFPILGSGVVARIANGTIYYNTSSLNNYTFDSDNDILIQTKYTVTAAGKGEVRNSITTLAATDFNLTRIVDDGTVASGKELGGIATFTKPSGETYMLGDVDDDGEVTVMDALWIQRKVAKMSFSNPTEELLKQRGEIDNDGELTVMDALLIQRHIALFVLPYPIGQYVTA